MGAGVTITAGLLISLCTGRQKDEDCDPSLYIPVVQKRILKAQAKLIDGSIMAAKGVDDESFCYHRNACNCANQVRNGPARELNEAGLPKVASLQLRLSNGKSSEPSPFKFEGVINVAFEPEHFMIPRAGLTNRRNQNQLDSNQRNNNDAKVMNEVIKITQL